MVRYLTWHEIKRNLRPARAGALLALCMIVGYNEISQPYDPKSKYLQGALTRHGDWLWWMIGVFVSGWVGSSLADERARGLTFTFFANGVSRREYLLSKMLGAAASGALLTFAAIAGFYLQVGLLWPPGRIVQLITPGSPGPVPSLYAVSPLGHDLLLAAMRIVSGAAWPLLGVLTGTFTANRYVAMALPAVLAVVCMLVGDFDSQAQALNPFIYFDLTSFYTAVIPAGLRPYAPFVYWACFALLVGALSRWSFERKELP
jgi:hypothetical protein